MIDLQAADTRVFLFYSADAKTEPGSAMDAVNQWLSKDRSTGPYANLRVQDITVTADGSGGIYTTIVCSLGRAASANGATPPSADSATVTAEPTLITQ